MVLIILITQLTYIQCKKKPPIKNYPDRTSSQDGGVGRYTLPRRTTSRKETTNLKTKNNQNCQKIELYGSPTTKELKKKHLYRLVGRAEDAQQGGNWRTGWVRWWLIDWVVPHLHADKPGGITGEWDRWCNPGFQPREIKLQYPWLKKTVGLEAVRNSQPLRRVRWRDPQSHTQT